jgi:hypothetical protein
LKRCVKIELGRVAQLKITNIRNIKSMFKNKIKIQLCLIIGFAFTISACSGDDRLLDATGFKPEITNVIGVNGYLWRASLDSLSALPLLETDSGGGVILSDWFINPDAPTERLKVSVFILDKTLRADAVKVMVVKQELTEGVWANASVRAGTSLQIENNILTRARELRIRSIDEKQPNP